MAKFTGESVDDEMKHQADMIMARNEGSEAYENGGSVNDNPYIEGSEMWKMWMEGWQSSKDNEHDS